MTAALIEAARAALEAWDSLPRKTYSLSMSVSEWLEYRMAPAIARLRTALAAAEQPAEPVALTPAAMKRGGFYNWKNQPDRLIYLRRFDGWHQFKKIGDPREVWCEVLDGDLHMLEETAASPAAPAQAPTDEFVYRVVRSVQPHLDDTCKAWGQEFAQCKYWLDAAHGIGSKA